MVSVRAASVVSLKFVEEVQTMAGLRLKSNSNPPVSPFSKGDFFSVGLLTPLWKRGREIFGRNIAGVMQRTSGS